MRAWSFIVSAAILSLAGTAEAGGLYYSDRGVRPVGRGGAFVAGADDLNAVWYNPAGLADAKTSVLVDASLLLFSADYTRQLRIVDADGVARYPTSPKVSGKAPLLPFPMLAASYAFGRRNEFTVAGAVFAPYAALPVFPATVSGQPSPARYALGSIDGSALAFVGAYFAYKPIERLRFGIGLGAITGIFQSTVTLSMSPPDRLVAAPESPDYDANGKIHVGPIVAPTGNLGVTWIPLDKLRFGTSVQLPAVISSHADVDVRLPASPVFDGARVTGSSAHVRFTMPAIFRIGAEVRPTPNLRAEFAYVREFWSMHDRIDIVPDGVAIENAAGLPARLVLPPISVPRHFQDSNSFRLGVEYTVPRWRHRLTVRAGVSYETSAVPPAYLSLISMDMNKVTTALGASFMATKRVRLDVTYAHVFSDTVHVSANDARIPRIDPIVGNASPETVNGGTYSVRADVVGVGAVYTF